MDAKGSFLAAVGAGSVYRLLGKKDLGTTEFPPIDTAVIAGDIGFRQHTGGHTPGANVADVPDVRGTLRRGPFADHGGWQVDARE